MKRVNNFKGDVIVLLTVGVLGSFLGIPQIVLAIIGLVLFVIGFILFVIAFVDFFTNEHVEQEHADKMFTAFCFWVGLFLLVLGSLGIWRSDILAT